MLGISELFDGPLTGAAICIVGGLGIVAFFLLVVKGPAIATNPPPWIFLVATALVATIALLWEAVADPHHSVQHLSFRQRAKDALRPWKAKARRLLNLRRDWPTIRRLRQFGQRFGDSPAVLVVGAFGGLGVWRDWSERGLIRATGLEPNSVECDLLKRRYPFASFHALGLSGETGKATLFLTENPQCYSCREPDEEVLSRWPVGRWFRVVGTAEIDVHRFDDLYPESIPQVPDIVDIDVQGLEREVFEGFGKLLDQVSCIKCETRLKAIYRGEMTFDELLPTMEERGFELRHLEPNASTWEGELVEFNAYFSRANPNVRSKAITAIWERIERIPPARRFADVEHILDGQRQTAMPSD